MLLKFFNCTKLAHFITYRKLPASCHFIVSNIAMSRRSSSSDLLVKSVELFKDETTKKHFTSDYETQEMVFRRGFPFKMMITLSRELKATETVEFELRMGGRPMVHHGSLIRLPRIDPKPDEDNVGHNLLASVGDIITVEIHTSAKTTGVGQWLLAMRPYDGRRRLPLVSVTNDIIAVFNPWSKYDPVYLGNESWREEYVLNEQGLQFYGNARRIGQMDWYFGQFEAVVMKACLKLLESRAIRYRDHSDPVELSRHMSALVNSNDDAGVLIGNWSGDYEDGKSPGDWVGSVAILKQYLETGPVKYGQCWVFSGVLTTVLRCFGMPARSVTNFESAHDTDSNLAVDYRFDKSGKSLDNDDSIWNFHVWNDVWMAREDLPEGYGGWQALDATPQEVSDRKFQCGPMPLHAIKEGELGYNYDGLFIYAEVNGSKRYWQQTDTPDEWEDLGADTHSIGKNISTKALNGFTREDVTSQYKYKEGSKEEELSFKIARKFGKFEYIAKKETKPLVKFSTDLPEAVEFGKDINFTVKFENLTKSSQSIFLSAVGKTMQYNGSIVAQIMDQDFTATLPASKSHQFTISLPVSKYLGSVKENNSVKFFFMGGVTGTQSIAHQEVVDFTKPALKIEVPSSAKLGKPVKVKVSFTNPLSIALDGGVFTFEGAGVKDAVTKTVGKVKPKGLCSAEVSIQPRKLGIRRLIVGFSSKNLQGVQGSTEINVS
uniref:Protein-glutamine gamma-glutamyltransferase K n=1 Tax=Phallusia mammillata TaxID=59560 RepID=A0A6F9DUW9_9ASCI|nr:protein-glutamine gamma-glutamyltransferase K [Phallusia mammillata]